MTEIKIEKRMQMPLPLDAVEGASVPPPRRPPPGPTVSAADGHHQEEWRAIKGYEGFYEVSNLGRVRSLTRRDGNGHLRIGRLLSGAKMNVGYFKLQLTRQAVVVQRLRSRLVCEAFHPNPNNLPEVNHKDGVKTNDAASNLEWVTGAENKEHAKRTGLNHNYSENHCFTKMTNEQVRDIRRRYIPNVVTAPMLAKEFGIRKALIYDLVNPKRSFKRLV